MVLPTHPYPDRPLSRTERFGSPAEWFAFLGPPVVWAAHFLTSYSLVSLACDTGSNVLLYAVTVVAAPMAIAAGVVAWRLWRQPESDRGSSDPQTRERTRFFGHAGVLMSGLFSLAILLEGAAPLVLDPCGSGV